MRRKIMKAAETNGAQKSIAHPEGGFRKKSKTISKCQPTSIKYHQPYVEGVKATFEMKVYMSPVGGKWAYRRERENNIIWNNIS